MSVGRWRLPALVVAVAGWLSIARAGGASEAPGLRSPTAGRVISSCEADDPIPTPRGYANWDRSSVVAWEAIEQYGGVVPDIEEDRSHAPPAWWRYPSALRSAQLLAEEARDPRGLYGAVEPDDLKAGDILVRTSGAGACGRMAIVVGQIDADWMTLEADGDGTATRSSSPVFFADAAGDKTLRSDVRAYRIRVKKDNTLGHVRELRRDLDHLERTVAERPPLIARNGRAAVDEKVHDLLDEAWSLGADPAFAHERRELMGRALALASALDWPGARALAAAVLDDAGRKAPLSSEAAVARAATWLAAGDPDRAVRVSEAALALRDPPPRAHYVLGRALLAGGEVARGMASLRRYLELDPADPRARRLLASGGAEPKLAPPPPPEPGLTFLATSESGGIESETFDLRARWPLSWRVVALSTSPDAGLLLNLATHRVLLDDGDARRGAVVILAQRLDSPRERKAMVAQGARTLFPDARRKRLSPLIPGSRRESFRERQGGEVRQGEVTTLERDGVVHVLVLNAPARAFVKLKADYAEMVRTFDTATAAVGPRKIEPEN